MSVFQRPSSSSLYQEVCFQRPSSNPQDLDPAKSVKSEILSPLHYSDALRVGHFWFISDKIGQEDGRLRAPVQEERLSPPAKGWQYKKNCAFSTDDRTIELGEPSLPCKSMVVELTGNRQNGRIRYKIDQF